MVIDSTVLARKALAIVPRWARYALVSSLIVGQLLPVVINVLVVVLDLGGTLIPRLSALQNYQWEALGIALTMPLCFLWRTGARIIRGPTPYDQAEEYIGILKMAVASARLNQTQERMFWNSALSKLSAEFSVGRAPPDPSALLAETRRDTLGA